MEPGIYDMPAAAYHADPCDEPSLSCSIAKLICQSSPLHARAAHPRLTPDPVDEHGNGLDVGTAAHCMLLEGVDAVAVIDAPDYRTKAAQQARDDARADGRVPLLAKSYAHVVAMVAAARAQLDAHRDGGAAMFLDGEPERVLIWRDDGGVWCRARLDWLRPTSRGDFAIDDYKSTSASANPDAWSRSLFSNGFDIQVAWYQRAVERVTGTRATLRFAVQETYPPYALSVITLGPDALMLAEKKVLYALDAWRAARASGVWPGYPPRTAYASLPPWIESEWLEKEVR